MKPAHLIALAILAIPTAAQQTPPDPCAGVPKPAPLVDVVIEPNAPKYSGPACLEGETCTTPADWDTRDFQPDGSVRWVFTYVGEARAVERNGRWETDELKMMPAPAPACWSWQWVPQS
jgi:hypothetical protein